jgi:hypothetical protein
MIRHHDKISITASFASPHPSPHSLPMDRERRREIQRRRRRYILLSANLVLMATSTMLQSIFTKEPYHTSILTGAGWVQELLNGHPERIRCELGMHSHAFMELVGQLRLIGHTNSKYVCLEEQIAIFLYACVTGLTSRHLGERFQRSNETISR